ncbi:hypothetical protein [Sinorhizobium meliloti]|uniref:hypothetical protein n=1 Tax=Rhizobium meliloti TaxID=382 RepID=UPI0013E3C281|nr:hypothetical protein [Sinorhizobium meliloti]
MKSTACRPLARIKSKNPKSAQSTPASTQSSTAGTANAIQATTSLPVSGSALIWMNVFEANTASPVTVSFNGGTALTIKTNSGNDVAVGGLTTGMIVLGIVSGSTFRLVSDQASSAIIAQAEAAQAAAAASAAAAAASAAAAEGVGAAVAVWPSGTLRTMKARATDTYCILDAPGAADPSGVNDSTSAFEAMAAAGVKCEITAGSFVLTRKLVIPDGVELVGQGRGYEFAHKTKLLFAGTGTKEHAIAGATATVVANPDAGAPYLADSGTRGNNYSTLDLTANFSAAVILGKASGLKGLGIYPNFNGVTGYAGTTGGLSDDWDVGVWARNADWWQIEDCNVSGHWRKSGLLVTAHNIGDGKVPSNEVGHAIRSHFQGFRGITIRSPETVVGNNWGFAGTDFINCLVRGLWHQSRHLATSSFLTTPSPQTAG